MFSCVLLSYNYYSEYIVQQYGVAGRIIARFYVSCGKC